ncbi:hypothetical protein CDAR_2631 [Caerostris darwini]|uniref:Uncharacterized protein n=1 Tax=Caerostris darwini TaxID=1538125 RepID=A0AAV4MZP6_9ARAC|nr:hypothetical protein CDAR_2631 [Caerostris darwini]
MCLDSGRGFSCSVDRFAVAAPFIFSRMPPLGGGSSHFFAYPAWGREGEVDPPPCGASRYEWMAFLNFGFPATRGIPAAAIFSLEPSRSFFPRFESMTQARGAFRGPSLA